MSRIKSLFKVWSPSTLLLIKIYSILVIYKSKSILKANFHQRVPLKCCVLPTDFSTHIICDIYIYISMLARAGLERIDDFTQKKWRVFFFKVNFFLQIFRKISHRFSHVE
eukprot:Sdes_comp20334_c0_seq1m14067